MWKKDDTPLGIGSLFRDGEPVHVVWSDDGKILDVDYKDGTKRRFRVKGYGSFEEWVGPLE